MRCMPWPTHGSGCGEERGVPEYLELARGGRGRGPGARRRRGAATTRASDRAGAAVLPPPDGGARRVRAHLLCDHRLRRTGRGTVPTVLPDRYRTPQPSALRPIPPRHRPAQSGRVDPGRVRRTRVARHRGRGDARGRHRRLRGKSRRVLVPALGRPHTAAARRRSPRPTLRCGTMMADGWHKMAVAWWSATFPGLAISLVVMALNAVGDALRDALDPRREAV